MERSGACRRGVALALLLLPGALGCQAGYVLRQGARQLDIVWSATDLDEARRGTSGGLGPERRRKLDLVVEVRELAASRLGLDVGDAYSTFYDNGDRTISYTVSAAHPLALVPYRWSFPFAGTVTYKGFFDRDDAIAERDRLRAEGWDTYLSRVAAFSTLGWFRDPVLATMLDQDDTGLVELLLHELVHRTVYFEGNTAANESMATAVARAGTRIFLAERFGEDSAELARYERTLAIEDARARLLERVRRDLDALYRSDLPAARKRRRKVEIFETASRALAALLGRDDISLTPSNARVLAVGQYDEHVALFERAIERLGGEPRRLMAFLKRLDPARDPVPVIRSLLAEPVAGESAIGSQASKI